MAQGVFAAHAAVAFEVWLLFVLAHAPLPSCRLQFQEIQQETFGSGSVAKVAPEEANAIILAMLPCHGTSSG